MIRDIFYELSHIWHGKNVAQTFQPYGFGIGGGGREFLAVFDRHHLIGRSVHNERGHVQRF